MRKIAIYGRGGIGKSTTTQNTVAGLAEMNRKVMVVGCDAKADSTRLLLGEWHHSIILDTLRGDEEQEQSLKVFRREGWGKTLCVESGGPEPGVGCTGRGILTSIGLLEQLGAYDDTQLDYTFYDGLGNVVCGGFVMPIRERIVQEVYIVTSGEIMAISTANNICRGIQKYALTDNIRLGGLICNRCEVSQEISVKTLAEELGTQVVYSIPRDNIVQRAEFYSKTVIEYAPDSEQAHHYRNLATTISRNTNFVVPKPLSDDQLEKLLIDSGAFDFDMSM
jgi:nitrogenase iron protein NifH